MKVKLKPLNKRVIVRLDTVKPLSNTIEVVTKRNHEEPFLTGTVEAIGRHVSEVTVGDKVAFNHFNGTDLPLLEEDVPDSTEKIRYRSLVEDDIAFVYVGDVEVG
jgi:co-chaperonin GroES (HSP10)